MARNRYIDAVRAYNVTVREFPTNLTAKMFDFEVKPNFTVQNEGGDCGATVGVVRHHDTCAAGAGHGSRGELAARESAGELKSP